MADKAYLTVYEKLKKDIQQGKYAVGSMLPTESELEDIFSVSRTTIRRAVSLLVEDGYIHVQQGRGTEVISGMPSEQYYKFHNVSGVRDYFFSSDKSISLDRIFIDRVSADVEIANALAVEEGEIVFRIQRILCNDGKPFAFVINYLRSDVAPDLDTYQGQFYNLYQFMEQHYQMVFKSASEHVSAVRAGFIEAHLLDVQPGEALLLCTRYAQSENCPMEFAKTYLRPDRYNLVVQMRGWPSQDIGPIPVLFPESFSAHTGGDIPM